MTPRHSLAPAGLLYGGASVIGQSHLARQCNNQDAFSIAVNDRLLVGAIADGCSSSPHAEVGAWLGVRWMTARLLVEGRAHRRDPETFGDDLVSELVDELGGLCRRLEHLGEPAAGPLADFFLFTLLFFVIDDEKTSVWGMGDGVHGVNGQLATLGHGGNTAPSYPAYRLLTRDELGGLELDPLALLHHGPTSEVSSLVIATDGWADPDGRAGVSPLLRALVDEPMRRASLLQRRVDAVARETLAFYDDATLIIVKREG